MPQGLLGSRGLQQHHRQVRLLRWLLGVGLQHRGGEENILGEGRAGRLGLGHTGLQRGGGLPAGGLRGGLSTDGGRDTTVDVGRGGAREGLALAELPGGLAHIVGALCAEAAGAVLARGGAGLLQDQGERELWGRRWHRRPRTHGLCVVHACHLQDQCLRNGTLPGVAGICQGVGGVRPGTEPASTPRCADVDDIFELGEGGS
mmetsp:Transcript_112248/g.324243  ORF Transcript_112248/g.324243 Transcript_112248/m.324243 type:complete len:203 (+) Transcript_112248:537-1145(+)